MTNPETVIIASDSEECFRYAVLLCGGIGLFRCSEPDHMVEFVKHLPEHLRGAAKLDDNYVFVLQELVEFLKPEELEIVMTHEEGHFILGHQAGQGSGIMINIENEISADAYAAGKHTPEGMIKVLGRQVEFLIEKIIPFLAEGDDELEDILTEQAMVVAKGHLTPRIKALQSMI